MKLAEALALRADAARRAERLRNRVVASARFQEGDTPAENAPELLDEAGRVLTELEDLIRRINRTNAATTVGDGTTLTDLLARRDVLRLRHGELLGLAQHATLGRHFRWPSCATGPTSWPGSCGRWTP